MADDTKPTNVRTEIGELLSQARPADSRERSSTIRRIVATVSDLGLERCLEVFLERRFGVTTLAELDDNAIPETFDFVSEIERLARA